MEVTVLTIEINREKSLEARRRGLNRAAAKPRHVRCPLPVDTIGLKPKGDLVKHDKFS